MAHTRLVLLAVCYSTFGSAETTCDSSLGFNAKTLNCNSCDEMKEFGLSKAIQDSCTSCCIGNEETENEEMSVYAKAELIICN
jgi:hypothetical protein